MRDGMGEKQWSENRGETETVKKGSALGKIKLLKINTVM